MVPFDESYTTYYWYAFVSIQGVQAGRSAMHAIHHTVAYLHFIVPEFIKPENWPPNSPDLNPADYSVWTGL